MRGPLSAGLLAMILVLSSCGSKTETHEAHEASEHGADAAEYERGPHRGRMLRDGNFAVEVTIFEDGVEPEFRLYAYRDDKPVAPADVRLAVELKRLGGGVDRFAFRPEGDFMKGDGIVREPHSFDVTVTASEAGRRHRWAYASHEGRTTIDAAAAAAGGVRSERAGPVMIDERIDMSGRIEITPEGKAEVRAWYPGRVLAMRAQLGDRVRKGQALARVESSHSLQSYTIPAPISGIVVEKNANVGAMTGDRPLFVVADPAMLHAEFFVYPRDAERIRVGQAVALRSLSGAARLQASVEAILPTADLASQTLLAHVHLPASAAEQFRPGMGVEGSFVVAVQPVQLAVRTKAIQRFREFEVVYAKVGNSYEVRMLEIGRRTPEWTEILGGLKPGAEYVTDGAFLIRADIEKAGASHDH